jgi:hypothetical protein
MGSWSSDRRSGWRRKEPEQQGNIGPTAEADPKHGLQRELKSWILKGNLSCSPLVPFWCTNIGNPTIGRTNAGIRKAGLSGRPLAIRFRYFK